MAALEKEQHPAVEAQPEQIKEKEQAIEGYLERVEKAQTPTAQVLDDTGQPVLTPTQVSVPSVTLPLTETEIKHGLHHKIFDSIRWLAAWCLRLAKKAVLLGVRVLYPNR